MKIYVASSWKNKKYDLIVKELRNADHNVYDFKNPKQGFEAFNWSSVDEDWIAWSPANFIDALTHPLVEAGFTFDFNALKECDCCVLVLPSGKSAHIEAGYAIGAGKKTLILLDEECEAELMYKMTPLIFSDLDEIIEYLRTV